MATQTKKTEIKNRQKIFAKYLIYGKVVLCFAVIFCLFEIFRLHGKIQTLENMQAYQTASEISRLQEKIQTLESMQTEQMTALKQEISGLKKIYVYDLEETLYGIKLDNLNREFEAKINILNDEVTSAQKKIASLKATKEKDDFSDVYLKSLKLKRDTMLQEYNNTIGNLTEEINRTVTEIAKEKGAVAVFNKQAIASQSSDIEEITPEVIKRIKLERPKILDK